MASSSDDFTLYPFNEVWSQGPSYVPTSSYAEQSYTTGTTYDSYPTQQTYNGQGLEHFTFSTDQTNLQPKNHLQAPSPTYSPSSSARHSFDYNPPVLSSNSDSGASVQSTLSSAMGSPSVHPQQASEWINQQNMSMLPSIVQHHDSLAQDMFTTTGYDLETIPATEKGCVGELATVSSSQQAQTVAPFPFPAFSSPYNTFQESAYATHPIGMESWPLGVGSQDRAGPQTSVTLSTGFESTSPSDGLFKSPTTPASATSPYQPISPVLARVKGQRKQSTGQVPKHKAAHTVSPLARSMSYHEKDVPQRPHAPPPAFSSPFFSQSSGIFVPPLESSCPSPYPHFVFST